MKKFLFAALAVIIAVVLCAPTYAVKNSNHFIDASGFNSDESEWEVLGWTVVDTEIVRLGYVLDGEDVVWVVDDVDVRDDNSIIEKNDCFEDLELEPIIAGGGMANGLEVFFAYRIHITLDTLTMEKGEHMLQAAAEYADGSIGNPFRDSEINFEKTREAQAPVETEPEVTEPDETEPDETEPEVTEPEESETEPEETEPEETEPDETEPEETEPDETEPDETEPDVTEPDETEPDETEPDETEPDETEPDETEPDETEPDETEPDETEPDETEEPVSDVEAKDVNGDGEKDNKDVVVLFRYVSSGEKADDESIYDINGDGEVNNKDVVALFRAISKMD